MLKTELLRRAALSLSVLVALAGTLTAGGCQDEDDTPPAPAAPPAPPTTPPAPQAEAPAEAGGDWMKQAEGLFRQGVAYIRENKLDDADNVLAKLEELKGRAPENVRPQVQQSISGLRNALTAAKFADGKIQLPGGLSGGGQGANQGK